MAEVTTQYALEREKRAQAARGAETARGVGRGSGGEALLCGGCGNRITSQAAGVDIAGSHQHTFANPHGLVFRIACFSTAPGCSTIGGEQVDFTWFAGYAWAVAQCGRCGMHLGWRFKSGVHVFYGLVGDRLLQSRAPDGHEQ
jgi:hypothetical protein